VAASLFDVKPSYQPLAARVRPAQFEDYIGQQHILGPGRPLAVALDKSVLHSMILWGPPGVGKTTFANLLATTFDVHFKALSAVLSGVKDIRAAVDEAIMFKQQTGRETILFVDEVHRFNKSQQDAFLPYVEDGSIVFVGATTENPSFELNNALLSRARVYVLKRLSEDELARVILSAVEHEKGFPGRRITLAPDALKLLSRAADGDARRCLNLLELAIDLAPDQEGLSHVSTLEIEEVMQGSLKRFDKGGDSFYEQISALHKSVRGSDPDAALYWFVRMLDGGCDPLYIARRLVRMASEDVGNADPRALSLAMTAWDVLERLGSPEGELSLAQAVVYLAVSAKSNATYNAYNSCVKDVKNGRDYDVPMHLRNAPTELMKEQGMGLDYRYSHDEPNAFSAGECYFPKEMHGTTYYEPVGRGLELKISEKLASLREANLRADSKRYP